MGIFTRRPANATATALPLLDPATGQPFPIISGTVAPGQIYRQQIPTSRFSPIALFYLNFLPIPGPTVIEPEATTVPPLPVPQTRVRAGSA